MKVLFVETKDSVGHINFYNHLLSSENRDFLFVTSEAFSTNFGDLNNVLVKTPWKKLYSASKITYRLEQFFLILSSLKLAGKDDDVVFMSYDTISLMLAIPFLKGRNIKVFEHNNIDQCLTSKIKSFSYKLLSSYVTSIVFEEYIGAYIKKTYDRDYLVYEHPKRIILDSLTSVRHSAPYIFMPSSDISREGFMKILEFVEKHNLLLYCKKYSFLEKEGFVHDLVKTSSFFENYNSLFLHAKYIAIPNNFSFRMSGVYYESIANNKKMLMIDCIMARELFNRVKNITII